MSATGNIGRDRWAAWPVHGGRIRTEVYDLVRHRQVWVGFDLLAAINGHDRQNALFHSWVRETYVASVAVGIRAQADRNAQSISLVVLLEELIAHPELVTRAGYLADRDVEDEASHLGRWAAEAWNGFAGQDRESLDPAVPEADLARLLGGTSDVRRVVNKGVAHFDEKAEAFRSDLDPTGVSAALDLVLEIFQKYCSNLANVSVDSRWVLPPWWTIFRKGWEIDTQILGKISGRRRALVPTPLPSNADAPRPPPHSPHG